MTYSSACELINQGNINALAKLPLQEFINQGGESLLYLACSEGHLEIVKLLLNITGIDVNKGHYYVDVRKYGRVMKGHDYVYTPLYITCSKGHLEIVKLLLASNANISHKEIMEAQKRGFDLENLASEIKSLTIKDQTSYLKKSICLIKKFAHDEFNGVIVCRGLLRVHAPKFLEQVLGNTKLLGSLDPQEKEILQKVVDYLIYGENIKTSISKAKEVLIGLFLLENFEGEVVELKRDLLNSIITQVNFQTVLDIIDDVNIYLEKSKMLFNGSTYLEEFKEYCLDFIGANSHEDDYLKYIENDSRLDKYLRTIVRRKSIRKITFDETPLTLPKNILSELFKDKSFCDVDLKVNGEIIKCHKTILASNSVYFETLFNSDHWTEMDEYGEETLYIIKYCYDMIDKIPPTLIIGVMNEAHKHEMKELIDIACDQVEITQDNFAEFIHSLYSHVEDERFIEVRKKLFKFACDNMKITTQHLKIIPECIKDDLLQNYSKLTSNK